MNFYPFHIGDYAGCTRGLSLLEDLAYRRCLDAYYQAEGPLTGDVPRLIGMREHAEAVAYVLSSFFKETPEGWRNKRCDEEIAAFKRMKEGGAKGAAKRWAKGGDSHPMPTPCPPHAHPKQKACPPQSEANANQEPLTINQKEQKKEQDALATRLPKDWQPTPAELAWAAADRPEIDARAEAEKFRDYWRAQGGQRGRKTDWAATWRNWIRNARASPQAQRTQPNTQPSRQMAAILAIGGVTHDQIFDAPRVVPEPNPAGANAVLWPEHARLSGG